MQNKEEQEKRKNNTEAFKMMFSSIAGQKPQNVVLSGTYSLSSIPAQSGQWYYVATCKKCGRANPIAEDASGGEQDIKFVGEGGVDIECQYCFSPITANRDEISRQQWK